MHLVCDKCTAVYTIDDGLVGQRDFRVSCKSCGKPIVVKSARQVNYAATQRVRMPGAALPPPSLMAARVAKTENRISSAPPAARSGDGWFILKADGQQLGPLSARDLAGMFESGELEWGSEVWRQGLKGWRAARRDPMLVTAVAGARGVANDTTRLDAARSFLAPEDTVVEARPGGSSVEHTVVGSLDGARSAFESREKSRAQVSNEPDSFLPPPPSARAGAKPDVLPDLRPSARPQAWHSPENMAFREALGLPTDSSQGESALVLAGKLEASLGDPPSGDEPATTLGDAFRAVPGDPSSESRQRAKAFAQNWMATLEGLPASVMERVDSHYWVAAGSFLAGVAFAALVMGRGPSTSVQSVAVTPAAQTAIAAATDEEAKAVSALSKSAADEALAVMPVATVHQVISSPLTAPAPALRELPTVEELRSEVRKVASDVRRCVDNPGRGVDVAIYLDGPSGRVRDLDVRSPALGPVRANCVTNAVRRIQLSPFAREELKLMHKFSW